MKHNIASIIIAVVIGGLAGICHYNSAYAKQKVEVKVIEAIPYESNHEEKILIRDVDIPLEVQLAAEKYGEEYNICPELLEAIAYYESTWKPEVDSKNGKYKGLMQISQRWHQARMDKLGVTDLHDADQNMHVAADYLADLYEKYEDTSIVLMAYNGDHSYKDGNISKYAKKIMKKSAELEEKHKKMVL